MSPIPTLKHTHMLTLKHLLPLSALALLPFTLPAASIPIESGEICWDDEDPNPTVFPNGFIAYNYLCDFSMQVGANPGSGGFTSLLGQDGSLLSFEAGGLELTTFSAPDSTGPIFLEYGASSILDPEDPYPGWAMFWIELTDVEDTYESLLFGSIMSLRFEANSFPPLDGVHQMRVRAHFVLDEMGYDTDPLAEALYAELMALTGNTGNLYLNTLATLNTDGSFSFGATEISTLIPEPGTIAAILAAAALTLGILRRRN